MSGCRGGAGAGVGGLGWGGLLPLTGLRVFCGSSFRGATFLVTRRHNVSGHGVSRGVRCGSYPDSKWLRR